MILDLLSDSNEEHTLSEIQKVLLKKGYSHKWDPIRYALKNLENAGLIDQNHLQGKNKRKYFIKEWYQRLGAVQAMNTMIMKWVNPDGDPPKHFYDMIPEERLEVEYHWAHGLFQVYSRLMEILVDKGLYNEEDDPVESGFDGTPWYGEEEK